MLVRAIVTDADRQWALDTLPAWVDRNGDIDGLEAEVGDDDGSWLDAPPKEKSLPPASGPTFVAEQAEAFERFFAGDVKTYADWSALWRKSWWPKADPARRFPKMAKHEHHPFFRAGTKEFERALELGTPDEKRIWKVVKVAQFKPDDPRVKKIIGSRPALTQTSRRIAGERD